MNSKAAVGYIPKKICYVYSDEEEVHVGCHWDVDWIDTSKNVTVKAFPAFPIEDGDEKSKIRAVVWAEKSYINEDKKIVKFELIDNEPVSGIRVLSVEEGTYKVLVGQYYVDMREDVLMDTIIKDGIQKDGILPATYVWAKFQSQLRLVRVGSELYKLIVEFESKKDIKPISKLEVGGIYQTRKKEKSIFIGYVNTTIFETTKKSWDEKANFKFKKIPIKKAMLFYDLFNSDFSVDLSAPSQFKIKKTHSFIEKLDQVLVPDNIVEMLRAKALKDVKSLLLAHTGHDNPDDLIISERVLEEWIARQSDHLNLYAYEAPPVQLFDIKKYLLFT